MRRPEIRPGFVASCLFACLLLPGPVFLPFLALAALHELGHLSALGLCGVPVMGVRLGGLGAIIRTGPMPPVKELFCSLAGPAVNLFAFWALRRYAPGAAIVSLALGLCNLLPLRPMDGGRALFAGLNLLLPLSAALTVCDAAETLTVCAAGVAALVLCRRLGALPLLLFALLLWNKARERNFMLPSGPVADIMKKMRRREVQHD